ncbi:hypothetical protein J437_LFUL016111 [Ladona fulva]|uniref:Uncharacterized protein n=1 Tax=Ladona fulva TaxID=123851 RepID=A0A8K0KNU8_LADFU|nr:hypothetical protein J437_LFUL016111 [Ladona fulva]
MIAPFLFLERYVTVISSATGESLTTAVLTIGTSARQYPLQNQFYHGHIRGTLGLEELLNSAFSSPTKLCCCTPSSPAFGSSSSPTVGSSSSSVSPFTPGGDHSATCTLTWSFTINRFSGSFLTL